MTKKAKVSGLEDTITRLQKLGAIDNKEIKKILRGQAGKILGDAKSKCRNAPVRNALGFITKNEGRFPTTVLIGVDSRKPGSETMTVAALASIEEFGSAPRFTKSGARRGQVTARPFMRPALDQNRESVRKGVADGIIGLVKKQAKKLNIE